MASTWLNLPFEQVTGPLEITVNADFDSITVEPGDDPLIVTVNNFPASQAVTGPLTNAELRAAAVAVDGPLTDVELRAVPVPISGTVSVVEPITVDATNLDIRDLSSVTDSVLAVPPAAAPLYGATAFALAGGANITDLCIISGSASKTITIRKVSLQGSSGANAVIDVLFIKRSTANSGGTSTTPTVMPFDSTSAAGTAVVRAYTVNPTLGTSIATFCSRKLFLNGSNTNPSETLILDWPIVLRGTAESVCINLNGLNLTGDTYNICFEWTEE